MKPLSIVFAASEFHLLGIHRNARLRRRGNLVLIVTQPLPAQLVLRWVAVVVDADDDEPSLRVRERASCLDAFNAKRLLQLEPLHLVFANDGFKFFACHAFFSGALFYHICRPYATPHFLVPGIGRISVIHPCVLSFGNNHNNFQKQLCPTGIP